MIGRQEPTRRPRAGYTLLELLIASLLLATLMAAVWNLMTMYSGFLLAGRSQVAEQQLARSLMDLLASDIGSIVPERPPHTQSPADPPFTQEPHSEYPSINRPIASHVDRSFGTEFPPPTTPPSSEVADPLPDFAIRGGGRSLTLIVTQTIPDVRNMRHEEWEMPTEDTLGGVDDNSFAFPDEGLSTGSPAASRAEEWKQILYHFEPPRTVHADDRGLPPGLHRFEIPVESLGRLSELQTSKDRGADGFDGPLGADVSAEAVEALTALSELGVASIEHEWIPEVVRCRFTYLAAGGWRSYWQADAHGDRPIAVRIELGLLSSREHEQLMAAIGSTEADAAIALPEVADAASAGAINQSDPFAAFHPRPYERMIVLAPRPNVGRVDEPSDFAGPRFDDVYDPSTGTEP